MEKIASFTIDHLTLKPGLYVSRKDVKDDVVVTTFDLRIISPNVEPVIDNGSLHTIEHLGATFLRNSERKDDIVYFGPMGCRTGCYLVMFGDLDSEDIYSFIIDMCEFVLEYEGQVPGASAKECGNYLEQDLPMAKYYLQKYKKELETHRRFKY
ncbi:MAG: S-ribosylhomocysteine lyase [Erysipelotrichaceae bacterium]|jgi:S-ribosylhomocysteine lyase